MDAAHARLAALAIEDFAPCVGQAFRLADSDAPLELTLLRADALGARTRGPGRRAPYSLVFRGPVEPLLPQQVRRLEHPALGVLDLFLVPVGRDEQGVRYESIFS